MTRTKPAKGEVLNFLHSTAARRGHQGCITWPYSQGRNGYGLLWFDGRSRFAHRVICQIVHGNPPTDTHHAAHSCGVRHCVNPDHLRWATPLENTLDKHLHGTFHRGSMCHQAKLSEEQARFAIANKGVIRPGDIAAMYGVSVQVISSIHSGRSWSWLSKGDSA